MRFSPIILLLFAILGCGSGSQSVDEGDSKAKEQNVETTVESNELPKVAETSSTVGDENIAAR